MTQRTQKAEALRELTLNLLELESAMQDKAVELTRPYGQTPARWKVLTASVENRLTVPQIARRMGLTRQAVQTIAHALVKEQLAEFIENPDHKSSPYLQPTAKGKKLDDNITRKYVEWSNRFAKLFHKTELDQCAATLKSLSGKLSEDLHTTRPTKRKR